MYGIKPSIDSKVIISYLSFGSMHNLFRYKLKQIEKNAKYNLVFGNKKLGIKGHKINDNFM